MLTHRALNIVVGFAALHSISGSRHFFGIGAYGTRCIRP